MSVSINENITKCDLLNRVVDIRAKIASALDDLTVLTGNNSTFFGGDSAEAIRDSIKGISSATSHVLIEAISIAAPEELDNFRPLFLTCQDECITEPPKIYEKEMLSILPEVASHIVSLIGITKAMRLFKVFGGTTFPVGKGIKFLGSKHARSLREILTEDEIKRLQNDFSGEVFYLPRCDRLLREIRNREFLSEFAEMRQSGTTALACMSVLPPKYGFSDRYGWQLLKKERDAKAAKL